MTFAKPESVHDAVRIAKHWIVGGGLAAGAGFYVYEWMERNPALGVELLRGFGSSFVLGLVALLVASAFLNKLVDHVGGLATGVKDMAASVAAIAAKDDRQYQEMRLLIQFSAQQSERNFEILREQREVLQRIEGSIAGAK